MNTSSLNLTRRYVLALSFVAVLSITAFITLRAAITAQETSAAVVNVAGRQRMLSQRISRFALLLVLNQDTAEAAALRETLQNNVALFEASHSGLLKGGSVTGISSGEILVLPGNPTTEVQKMYFSAPMNLDQQVTTYIEEARLLLAEPKSELTLENSHLRYLLTASASEILTSLNTVTSQYQKESEAAIAGLGALEAGVLGITLITLLVEALFIFRPMVQQITQHTEELEEKSKLVERQNLQLESRARAITLSAEVSRHLSVARTPHQLAVDVVEQVQSAFKYYHAHIYFVDETTGDLIMAGGTGEAGTLMLAQSHKVPKGRGLVGRAAETKAPVLVSNVLQAEGWLPNPLLPDTKSEAAIPILLGQQVLGILDVQQNIINGLHEDDVDILQSLAGQVAISLQNARSFEQSKSQADLESLVNIIGQKIQRATTMEETLQTAIRELGTALGATRVSASIGGHQGGGNGASQN
jgi:putative methionine-R-sulfoxide reductase with GAF domain